MKKTGLTRRIDELGRIVIPKEIRKNLKIRDSDELEIYVQDDSIILNKFSIIEQDKVLKNLLYCLNRKSGKNVLLTSKDTIIDYYNNEKNLYEDIHLSDSIIKIINKRATVKSGTKNNLCVTNKMENVFYLMQPIIINGDLIGSIIVYSNTTEISENDEILVLFCTLFLEKYLE